MLLNRVVGGHVRYTDEPQPDAEQLTKEVVHGGYHSVLGDRGKCRGTFKEFVVFASDQVYPEYIVTYKRIAQLEPLNSLDGHRTAVDEFV